jgi:hypothetical protein
MNLTAIVASFLLAASPLDVSAEESSVPPKSQVVGLYHYYGDPVANLPADPEGRDFNSSTPAKTPSARTRSREVIRAFFQQSANPFQEEHLEKPPGKMPPSDQKEEAEDSEKNDAETNLAGEFFEEAPPADMLECLDHWLRNICYFGWIEQGVTLNTLSPRGRSNFPVGFNNDFNNYQMNQTYLALQKPVDRSASAWDIGGRVDFLYGTDAVFTESRGLETHTDFTDKWNDQRYGLALPQCYLEVFAPGGTGLTLKLGHFYTTVGYENVPAIDNFFYSHSYEFLYGEPLTHTGLLAAKKIGPFTFQAGMTRGWNNWEDNDGNLGVLGSLCCTNKDGTASVAFAIHSGREQHQAPDDPRDRTIYSLVYCRKFGERWQYVLQHDNGLETGTARGLPPNDWFGINQYLFYAIDDNLKAGVRFEWFRDDSGTQVGLHPSRAADYYETSLGLNWTPRERVVLRPEVRFDWVDAPGYQPFADGSRRYQLLVDCDLIVRF